MERARRRDPKSGFVSYVPPGTLAKGKELVENGGGKTIGCEACHGQGQKGNDNIPRLAGNHPIYTARQLYLFKDNTRDGDGAGLMKGVVEQLTDDDILAISAYLGSLAP
jgi:cytochrome c553